MKKTQSQNSWLQRQGKDIFVKLSKAKGYRSRAVYKLIDINYKFNIIKKNTKIIDLGASPGGWTQVIVNILKDTNYEIVAIDKLNMEPIKNCSFILDDIESFLKKNNSLNSNSYELILSDMAPNSSGHRFTDQASSEKLFFLALEFALKYLISGGNFVCKIMRNSVEKKIVNNTKKYFKVVKVYKPPASRKDSKEIYMVALGFNNLHKG
ncbi:MAG: rRNA methyltransferase [Rickettsiales bacterium]|nr:rRNA methyltransferase [Rickettsiales bacterium]OUV79499.1 MAG: hypothetical protein CBC91_03580 [Rickettsiales bacterium TMED131]